MGVLWHLLVMDFFKSRFTLPHGGKSACVVGLGWGLIRSVEEWIGM